MREYYHYIIIIILSNSKPIRFKNCWIFKPVRENYNRLLTLKKKKEKCKLNLFDFIAEIFGFNSKNAFYFDIFCSTQECSFKELDGKINSNCVEINLRRISRIFYFIHQDCYHWLVFIILNDHKFVQRGLFQNLKLLKLKTIFLAKVNFA